MLTVESAATIGASLVAVLATTGGAYYRVITRLVRLESRVATRDKLHALRNELSVFALRAAANEVKINTIWDFMMRRALSEAVSRGVGSVNSPFVLSDSVRQWFVSLKDELHQFYRDVGHALDVEGEEDEPPREIAMELERRFGQRITHEICIPRGLMAGSCLLAALSIAREAGKPELPKKVDLP